MHRFLSPAFRAVVAAVFLCGLSGCGDDGRVVREDSKIRYIVHGDAEVEPEQIDWAVEQVDELAELFGTEVPQLEYHMYESLEDLGEICGESIAGCRSGDRVHSTRPAHTHELVHFAHRQSAPSVIREGLAEILEPLDEGADDVIPAGSLFSPIDIMGELEQENADAFPRQAALTRFFMDELGWQGLLEFGERAAEVSSRAALEEVVESTFERSVAELEEDFSSWQRLPSTVDWWVLDSHVRQLSLGQTRTLQRPGPALQFEHDENQRTIVRVVGEGSLTVMIEHPEEGKMHTGGIFFPEGSGQIVMDGPTDSYLLYAFDAESDYQVTLERQPLSDPLPAGESEVVGFAGSHTAVCWEGSGEFEIDFRATPPAAPAPDASPFDALMATSWPEEYSCCQGDQCETHAAWNLDLGAPQSFTCSMPTCVVPGETYPEQIDNFQLGLMGASPLSGRFVGYRLTQPD